MAVQWGIISPNILYFKFWPNLVKCWKRKNASNSDSHPICVPTASASPAPSHVDDSHHLGCQFWNATLCHSNVFFSSNQSLLLRFGQVDCVAMTYLCPSDSSINTLADCSLLINPAIAQAHLNATIQPDGFCLQIMFWVLNWFLLLTFGVRWSRLTRTLASAASLAARSTDNTQKPAAWNMQFV